VNGGADSLLGRCNFCEFGTMFVLPPPSTLLKRSSAVVPDVTGDDDDVAIESGGGKADECDMLKDSQLAS
jgi:hypothetical protein